MTTQRYAFKILTADQWAEFQQQSVFLGAPVDLADGYIHLSTATQLKDTLEKHFNGQTGLVILEIDLSLFGEKVRWEVSRGGDLFPHLYGSLTIEAVAGVQTA